MSQAGLFGRLSPDDLSLPLNSREELLILMRRARSHGCELISHLGVTGFVPQDRTGGFLKVLGLRPLGHLGQLVDDGYVVRRRYEGYASMTYELLA